MTRFIPGKISIPNAAAGCAGFAFPAALLAVNTSAARPVFTPGDLVFSVFVGVALAACILVWARILRGDAAREPAPGRMPRTVQSAPSAAPEAAPPGGMPDPALLPGFFKLLLPLGESADMALLAPVSGLDSTLRDLRSNVERLPVHGTRAAGNDDWERR